MVRVRVVASGRVQGVCYRDSCRRRALAAGVSGWVRNRSDGTVEAVLEGEPDAVDRLVGWMRSGPPAAEVTDLEVTPEAVRGERNFVVR